MISNYILFQVLTLSLLLFGTVMSDYSVWPPREFRGTFVATVANIDWPSSRHLTSTEQKREFIQLLNKLQQLHFNAIVFQVRAAGDAFYNSSIEPWSYYLTGRQGKPPSEFYDPLSFAVSEAHQRNIEVHAWFNPYRARAGSTSTGGLAHNHVANIYPQYVYKYGNNLWMDPGATAIYDHVLKVFLDVVTRYDIDGIHIDDYFYPYPVSGTDFPDSKTYGAYRSSGGTLGLPEWRRQNVNNLIKALSTKIKSIKPHVKFGISPFGIWQPGHPNGIHGLNAYNEIYADAKKWFSDGWVDYLAPQLYWQIDPPAQSYPALLDWWCDQNMHGKHVYTSNYASAITVKHWSVTEIERQVEISRSRASNMSLGNIHFSVKYFVQNIHGISDRFKSGLYMSPVLPPAMPWLTYPYPPMPANVKTHGLSVSWDADTSGHVRSWAIFHFVADVYDLVAILPKESTSYTSLNDGFYSLVSLNRVGVQSKETRFTVSVTPVG